MSKSNSELADNDYNASLPCDNARQQGYDRLLPTIQTSLISAVLQKAR